jgi:predicted RNA-binding protein with PIN domain
MKFILDAYNVIGQLDHIQLSDPNKVPLFIDWLSRNASSGMYFQVIFDGKDPMVGFPTTEKRPGMTIVHTPGDQTADAYIKQKVDQLTDRSSLIVVTSDRDILHYVRKKRVKTLSASVFILHILQTSDAAPEKQSPVINDRHVDQWLAEFGE